MKSVIIDKKELFLNELERDVFARIDRITAPTNVARRLKDMGLIGGVRLYISSKAPLGDPIVVSFEDFDLSLRLDMAKYVLVTLDEEVEDV